MQPFPTLSQPRLPTEGTTPGNTGHRQPGELPTLSYKAKRQRAALPAPQHAPVSGGRGLRASTAPRGEPRAPCLPPASHRVAAALLLSGLIPILIKGLLQIRALRKHDLLSPFLLPLNDTVPFPARTGCLQIQILRSASPSPSIVLAARCLCLPSSVVAQTPGPLTDPRTPPDPSGCGQAWRAPRGAKHMAGTSWGSVGEFPSQLCNRVPEASSALCWQLVYARGC